MVTVTMTGRHDVRSVRIDPALMGEDKEMLEDLIAAAVNDAVHKVEGPDEGSVLRARLRSQSSARSEAARSSLHRRCAESSHQPSHRALRCLPGVGPKSAQRMAFHLLERDREAARELAGVIEEQSWRWGGASRAGLSASMRCVRICASPRRDSGTLCVVETPADMAAIDASTGYQGMFFVLMGHLSPLDGIGRRNSGSIDSSGGSTTAEISEVILATSSTVEGEATAHYLAEAVRERGIRASRIAQGVPMGGELEFVDGGTLARAIMARRDAILTMTRNSSNLVWRSISR